MSKRRKLSIGKSKHSFSRGARHINGRNNLRPMRGGFRL